MALSYTQKTSDNSLITKYVGNNRPICFLVAHMTCADRKRCTTSSALTLSRTGCTWRASSPPTVTPVNCGTRRTLLSRCGVSLDDQPGRPPAYHLGPASSSSLSSQSRPRPRSSEFSKMTKRANSLTYVASLSSTAED